MKMHDRVGSPLFTEGPKMNRLAKLFWVAVVLIPTLAFPLAVEEGSDAWTPFDYHQPMCTS